MPEIKIVVEREAIDSIETNLWLWNIIDEDNKVYDSGKEESLKLAVEKARENLKKVFRKHKICNE